MKSILEGRPQLKAVIDQIAEVTGYLWQKGWAERNGGNITVNVTEYMDDECKKLPPISEVKAIGLTLPQLKGKYFYCKGTGKRMRDLAREPMQNGSIIRILDDCASYVVIADVNVVPTSELPTHLANLQVIKARNPELRVVYHCHPVNVIALGRGYAGTDQDPRRGDVGETWHGGCGNRHHGCLRPDRRALQGCQHLYVRPQHGF